MEATMFTRLFLGLSLTLLVTSVVFRTAEGIRTTVGDRSDVPDVENNQEIQELGRHCVEEYNLKQEEKQRQDGSDEVFSSLKFSLVVEAQQQIVSGKKYFLRILVTLSDGTTRLFDSVVVVKPWTQSRQLLEFSPVVDDSVS